MVTAVATEQSADDDVDIAVHECAEIGVGGQLHLFVVVRARRYEHIGKDLELLKDPLPGNVQFRCEPRIRFATRDGMSMWVNCVSWSPVSKSNTVL